MPDLDLAEELEVFDRTAGWYCLVGNRLAPWLVVVSLRVVELLSCNGWGAAMEEVTMGPV